MCAIHSMLVDDWIEHKLVEHLTRTENWKAHTNFRQKTASYETALMMRYCWYGTFRTMVRGGENCGLYSANTKGVSLC
jgi:hypothetical protein